MYFQKQPPLFLEVSQIQQENTCTGVSFYKSCRPAGPLHVCFSWYLIIHVINLFFYDIIWVYFSVTSYSIAFLDNCLIALDIKIDKIQTCLNSTHNNLLFNDRPKSCNFIKKETLAQMFSCEFCKISRNKLFIEHISG